MIESQGAAERPDLVKGVTAAELVEGGKLVGRVGDDEVLVARVNGGLFAIGAHCTHYGGQLGDGLIVGDTVRCPLHHARFCLRSGEALAAPAIDPVKCWKVTEADGLIRVEGEMPDAETKPAPRVGKTRRVLIIGGGAAGFGAAELLRREGFDGSLTMLSADADAPYDRPNCSKDYLAGEAQPEWMPLRAKNWYADHDIDLQLNAEATGLDAAPKSVSLKDGRSYAYDALLIATGAEPVRLPIEGFARPDVHVLRSLRDADVIIESAKTAKRVAIVGASFIGLEVAAALRVRGLEVHVAAPDAVPLARVMGDEIGRWICALHEQSGIVFHLGHAVRGWKDGALILDGGTAIEADFVVTGAGVRPRTQIAEMAGLRLDHGILVDAHLLTNAPNVYAAGDVARFPDRHSGENIRVEHWVHAERQGQHVARMILGDDSPFNFAPFFWSKHQDVEIRYVGHAEILDQPVIDGSLEQRDAEARFLNAGRLVALATIGRDLRSLETGVEFER